MLQTAGELDVAGRMEEQIDRRGEVRHFQEAVGQRSGAITGNN